MLLTELKESLQKEFYVRNLYSIANTCREMASDTTRPTPFFILGQIFTNIANKWDDMPLEVDHAESVKSELIGTIKQLIYAIELEASDEQLFKILNDLISIYLRIKI